jgi:hypothetical protein
MLCTFGAYRYRVLRLEPCRYRRPDCIFLVVCEAAARAGDLSKLGQRFELLTGNELLWTTSIFSSRSALSKLKRGERTTRIEVKDRQ